MLLHIISTHLNFEVDQLRKKKYEMKLVIILAVIAWTNGDKLDKTYLPPSHARTSGGAGNFLQTPRSSSQEYRGPGAQNGNIRARNGNGFSQNGFTQNGNGFSQNGNGFSQNGNGFSQNGNGFSQNNGEYNVNGFNSGFENRPERAQAAFERNAGILRLDNSNDGETYSFAYETENGISAEENGVATNGVEAQGGFSYTGDDGQVYSIRYTADQNGFVPEGDHLPTPPPIPEEILKALEQNARDEAAGIYDDGSYNEAKYGNGDQYNGNGYNGNGYSQNSFNNQAKDDSVVTNSALLRGNGGFRNTANGNIAASFRNQVNGASFRNQGSNEVNNAYLPPTQRNGNGRNGFGSRNRQPTYNDRDGYRF